MPASRQQTAMLNHTHAFGQELVPALRRSTRRVCSATLFLLLLLSIAPAALVSAQTGTLDPTFLNGDRGYGLGAGPGYMVKAIAVQPDGKIIIAGSFDTYNTTSRNRVARLNTDGTLDATFNAGTGPNGDINTVALQADGKVLLGGDFTNFGNTGKGYLVRLNADGSVDNTFNSGGAGPSGSIATILLESSGKILLGGKYNTYNGTSVYNLVRLNSDGSIDNTFNTGTGFYNAAGSGTVYSIARQADGKYVVGGVLIRFNGNAVPGVIRLNSDGSIDNTFALTGDSDGSVRGVAVQADGKILIGGYFSRINNVARGNVTRVNSNGSTDATFTPGTGAINGVFLFYQQADARIVIMGQFTSYNGTAKTGAARLNTDGTLDATFNTGGAGFNTGYVLGFAVQADGKLLMGGNYGAYNGKLAPYFVRVNTDGTPDLTFNPHTGVVPMISPLSSLIYQADGKIVIAGPFNGASEQFSPQVARLNADGTADASFTIGGQIFDGSVNKIAVQPDGKIVVCGYFTKYNYTTTINRITRLNANGSLDASFATNVGTGASDYVYCASVQSDGKLLIAGGFTSFNGSTRGRVARLNADGTLDASFAPPGSGFDGSVFGLMQQPDGKVLVWGYFNNFNGTAAKGVARLNSDGTLDATFNTGGSGANSLVRAALLQPDGKILIGGDFTTFNGTSRSRLARLNADGSLDATFAVSPGLNNTVSAIGRQSDGRIIVAGDFTAFSSGQQALGRVARYLSNGTPDYTYISGSGADASVSVLAVQPDDYVVIGGTFASFSGTGRNHLARIREVHPTIGTVAPTSYCSGTSVSIPFTTATTFDAGNVFTAQLSNASGQFSSPVTLGTLSGTGGGTITAAIPANTATGSGYRIRIVSSSPAGSTDVNDANLQITLAPFAQIGYNGSPYCASGSATPTRLGTLGGSFSATPAGLSLNAGTGAVNLTASAGGAYTVTYAINANGACPALQVTTPLTVTALPQVNQPGNQSLCAGSTTAAVVFSGTGTTYNWTNNNTSIGLAASGSGNIAPFTATNTSGNNQLATLSVRASVANGSGTCTSAASIFTIAVLSAPVTTIAYTGSPYCGTTGTANVNFSGYAGGSYTASPAGLVINPATGAVDIAASADGNYTVTYNATSSGCPIIATAQISIRPAMLVSPVANQALCADVAVAPLSFTVAPGLGYGWQNDNTAIGLGASGTGTMPAFTTANSTLSNIIGNISVTPTGGTGCTLKKMVFRYTIKPGVTVNQPGNQVLCAGTATTPVAFTGALAGTVFSWTNDNTAVGLAAVGSGNIGSFTANNTNNTVQTATVQVTPSAGGCTGPAISFTYTVSAQAGSISYPASPYCQGGWAYVDRVGSSGGLYAATPAGLSLNSATGAINLGLSQPGTYTVTYTAGLGGACNVTASTSLTVLPQASVNPMPNLTFCPGDLTTPQSFTGSAASFTWTNSQPAIGLPASGSGDLPAFNAANPIIYPLQATILVTPVATPGLTCPTKPMSFRVTVNPKPYVTYVPDQVYCRGQVTAPITFSGPVAGTTYRWTSNNPNIGLAALQGTNTIPSFTTTLVTYTFTDITVTPVANGCYGDVDQVRLRVDNCGPTSRMAVGASITLSPNPAQSNLSVTYESSDAGPVAVQIVDRAGQLAGGEHLMTGKTLTLDVSGLMPGAYWLQFRNPRTQVVEQRAFVKL